MNHPTVDYLKNSLWFFQFIWFIWANFSQRLKKFFVFAVDLDYDFFLLRIIENLPYAFFILFLGSLAVFTLAISIEKELGIKFASIMTSSMSPTIPRGSLIIISPSLKYEKKDIVSFKEKDPATGLETGSVITHRIEEVSPKGYITKGDANEFPDRGFVEDSQILGKVVFILPYLGFLEEILKRPVGFIVFILIPSFVLVKNELLFIREELKKIKEA